MDRYSISEESDSHLPPAIIVKFILLDDLYALARTKGEFVLVLWGEVMASIDVFYHEKYHDMLSAFLRMRMMTSG